MPRLLRYSALPTAFLAFVLAVPVNCHAQGDDMVPMVLETLRDPESDKDIRGIFLDEVRTGVTGTEATKKFAEAVPTLPLDARSGLIAALADRGDVAAKPAILAAMDAKEESVQIAAIRAIAKLGGPEDCPKLVECLQGDAAVNDAAKLSLIQIQGTDITKAIANTFEGAAPKAQAALIDVLASRRAMDTIPLMLKAAVSSDSAVRKSAMKALGGIADAEHIPGMVQGVLKAEGPERGSAERSLAAVCNRIADPAQRAQPLLQAMDALNADQQRTMLVTLGRVGGDAALARVEKALADQDGKTHYAGLAALANWPNSSIAKQLEELAYNDPSPRNQRVALRAMIRLAPVDDGRTYEERLDFLKRTMDMSIRVDDRRYCLQRAGAIRIPDSLRWVLPFVEDQRYAEQACTSIVELAHIRDLRDDNKAEFHAALDKVLATSKNAETLERADRYKKGQTWERPK